MAKTAYLNELTEKTSILLYENKVIEKGIIECISKNKYQFLV